jgi:hypothetical protein
MFITSPYMIFDREYKPFYNPQSGNKNSYLIISHDNPDKMSGMALFTAHAPESNYKSINQSPFPDNDIPLPLRESRIFKNR